MFDVIDVFNESSRLVVCVNHLHADNTFWHLENYTFQGREGMRRSIKNDSQGFPVMDDGMVPPMRDKGGARVRELPVGREWAMETTFNMTERHILLVIRGIHQQRLLSGWPQDKKDELASIPGNKLIQQDYDGVDILVTAFQHMKGKRYDS